MEKHILLLLIIEPLQLKKLTSMLTVAAVEFNNNYIYIYPSTAIKKSCNFCGNFKHDTKDCLQAEHITDRNGQEQQTNTRPTSPKRSIPYDKRSYQTIKKQHRYGTRSRSSHDDTDIGQKTANSLLNNLENPKYNHSFATLQDTRQAQNTYNMSSTDYLNEQHIIQEDITDTILPDAEDMSNLH
ncbi:hypothetical protein C1646_773241 [Rhizophagus diaphanus]|nr:hypothetical protein C1646_773241 [Rhizophagus diaphanus] [Rhizophagus sp. MUCL 43196]